MKADTWQFEMSQMASSTDQSDPAQNSFRHIFTQCDARTKMMFQVIDLMPTSGPGMQLELWVQPASGGMFTQFWRSSHQQEYCYYRNVTDQGWFNLPCFQPPDRYTGDVLFGSELGTEVWMHIGGLQNTTHAVQMDQCLPVAGLMTMYDEHYFEQTLVDFFNEKFSVDDPGKFQPPSNCRPALATFETDMKLLKLAPTKPFSAGM